MGWLYAILLKPFFLFGFYVFVRSIEIGVSRLPDSRIRRALLRRW